MHQIDAINLACHRSDCRIFADLSFSAVSGDIVWVTGPNGAGKTTLLRCLAGLLPLSAGQIRWDGAAIQPKSDEYRGKIGWFGHRDGLLPLLSVRDNLRFSGGRGVAQFGVSGLLDHPVQFLSEGQRKRVALSALLQKEARPVWLLDEPFANLDRQAMELLRDVLQRRSREGWITFFTSHQENFGLDARELRMGA